MNKNILLALLATMALLSGCKTTQPIYYHGSYNTNVYQHFANEDTSVEQQIADLQQTIELASTENIPVAPGVLAHLGYLYLKVGDTQSGLTYLNNEKSMYPESEKYIDFLISNIKEESIE